MRPEARCPLLGPRLFTLEGPGPRPQQAASALKNLALAEPTVAQMLPQPPESACSQST